MRYRSSEMETWFKSFKRGDADALDLILEAEKARLFDYLMRMTGQVTKSQTALEDAIGITSSKLDREETLQELLVLLYKSARNQVIEIWNAETARLENSAYAGPSGNLKNNQKDKNFPVLIAIENVIRSLSPKQREALILHQKYGFAIDEVAEITGYASSDVEELFAQALSVTEAAMAGDAEQVPELMTKLYLFPIPEDQSLVTQNLSMVFKDLKKSSRSTPSAWYKLLFAVLVLGGVVAAAYNYEALIAWIDGIRA